MRLRSVRLFLVSFRSFRAGLPQRADGLREVDRGDQVFERAQIEFLERSE